ncbi:hypothetical protein B0H13DRAFT_1952333 [Mycena leptocephala]|nr:hypothetical protein B0H13DRAFT_1952333 [Mycena leptocephala]
MPVAEIVGVIAGTFNVGSFVVGSGPEAISRLANGKKKTQISLKSAEEDADFVLRTLKEYGRLISREEHQILTNAYFKYAVDRAAVGDSREDPPRTNDYLVKVAGHKMFRKMSKETRIRKAVEQMAKNIASAKDDAVSISTKAVFKQALAEGLQKPPTPPKDGNSMSTCGTNTYPPESFRVPNDETDSVISRVFRTRMNRSEGSRTASSPSGKPQVNIIPPNEGDSDPDIDEVDLGEPLARVDTGDTFVSAYSSTCKA